MILTRFIISLRGVIPLHAENLPNPTESPSKALDPEMFHQLVLGYDMTYGLMERCYDTETARSLRGALRQFVKSCPLGSANQTYFEQASDRIDKSFSEYWTEHGHPPENWRDSPTRCGEWDAEFARHVELKKLRLEALSQGKISLSEALDGMTCEYFREYERNKATNSNKTQEGR